MVGGGGVVGVVAGLGVWQVVGGGRTAAVARGDGGGGRDYSQRAVKT